MKPIYHHYETWEDFQNGMYNEDKNGREERVEKAKEILSNAEYLYKCMKRVTKEWVKASEQNLSNGIYSHQAFLGQCACAIDSNIHEDETRQAWGLLTDEQRKRANRVADIVYEEWLKDHQDQISLF